MDGVESREAYFLEVLAYTEYGKKPVVFTSKTEGTLAKTKSGENGWSWDFIFISNGCKKTMACYPDNERWKFWHNTAYFQLSEYIKNKSNINAKDE